MTEAIERFYLNSLGFVKKIAFSLKKKKFGQ